MSKPKHLNKTWPKSVNEVLLAHHLVDLRKSKLSNKIILGARIYSASSAEAKILLKRKTEVGAGYVIPYLYIDGFSEHDLNFKPDVPLPSNEEGKKPRKYLQPIGAEPHLYIPSKVWPIVNDISIPIFITEGEKKALKACQEGYFTIAISGVWNWSSGHEPIKDFDLIKWDGRIVYLVFDSDKFSNKSVLLAERRLAETLTAYGARVKIIDLPEDGHDC